MIQENVPSIGEEKNNTLKIYEEEGFKDFKLFEYRLQNNSETSFETLNNSILFVLQGDVSLTSNANLKFAEGQQFATYFIEKNMKISISAKSESTLYIATY